MFVKYFEHSVVFCCVVDGVLKYGNQEKKTAKRRNSLHNAYLINHILSFTASC